MELNYKELEDLCEILKVLAHPVRLCIVRGLSVYGGCNVSKMQQCLDMPQSTVSQHLAKLKAAGIIEGERNGLEIIYKVKSKKIEAIVKTICEEV